MITALAGWHGLIFFMETLAFVYIARGKPLRSADSKRGGLVTNISRLNQVSYGLRDRPASCRLFPPMHLWAFCAHERVE